MLSPDFQSESNHNYSINNESIENPYEEIFKFMIESEVAPRKISKKELDVLRNMYEDFQELSSRYDGARKDKDDLYTAIEKEFLNFPKIIEPTGFRAIDFNLWDNEDESCVEKIQTLFSHLNKTCMSSLENIQNKVDDSPSRYSSRQADMLRSSENALRAEIDILKNDNQKLAEQLSTTKDQYLECSKLMKGMNDMITHKENEVDELKRDKVKNNETFAARELEMENEILDLCEEVNKKTKNLEELESRSPLSPKKSRGVANLDIGNDISALTREQLKTELADKVSHIKYLEQELDNLTQTGESAAIQDKELIDNLFKTINECMWTITQLRLGRPKKFTTSIGGLSQIIAKSVMGPLLEIESFADNFFVEKKPEEKPKPKLGLGGLFGKKPPAEEGENAEEAPKKTPLFDLFKPKPVNADGEKTPDGAKTPTKKPSLFGALGIKPKKDSKEGSVDIPEGEEAPKEKPASIFGFLKPKPKKDSKEVSADGDKETDEKKKPPPNLFSMFKAGAKKKPSENGDESVVKEKPKGLAGLFATNQSKNSNVQDDSKVSNGEGGKKDPPKKLNQFQQLAAKKEGGGEDDGKKKGLAFFGALQNLGKKKEKTEVIEEEKEVLEKDGEGEKQLTMSFAVNDEEQIQEEKEVKEEKKPKGLFGALGIKKKDDKKDPGEKKANPFSNLFAKKK